MLIQVHFIQNLEFRRKIHQLKNNQKTDVWLMKRGSKTLGISNKNKFIRGYVMLNEHLYMLHGRGNQYIVFWKTANSICKAAYQTP